MRLFFAIEVPVAVKDKIVASQQRMAAYLPPKGFRVVKPEMLHVTLAFLGEIAESNLDKVKESAMKLAAEVKPSKLIFDGIGCFPAWRHPRVLWVGVTENGFEPFQQDAPLAKLGHALSAASKDYSDHAPEERVLLHVTLARSSDRLKKEDMRLVGELAAADFWSDFGDTLPQSVVLYESTLGKNGPVQHIPLARFPLKS